MSGVRCGTIAGVWIALLTDWSPSGSFNMREEIKCAGRVAGGALSAFDLSAETFARHVEGSVPVNDVSRQAPCAVTR